MADIFAQRRDIRSDVWGQEICFERGRSYLVEAQSGTGKSTLCSFLYGLRCDYSGSILFDGEDIAAFDTARWAALRRESLGMLFQELRLFPELTARENVEIKNRLTHTQSEARIEQWFESLGIADKRDTPIGKMSYGQQQRVALIRALCQRLDFVILDEPVSHLDQTNSDAMRDVLLAEVERQGAGIIATSIGKQMEMKFDKTLLL